ncbi:P-II family nitrogen regulator, partial [Candidatus Woesearchaeota archaeon]|nr:P-II family nitrogen regulator [Candidatus Woesearchaeota archaeon]
MIGAVIKPQMLDDVKERLEGRGFKGFTVTEVRGFGEQKGHRELYAGSQYTIDFLPKIKLEIAVTDGAIDDAVNSILQTARTGSVGDGLVWVAPQPISPLSIRTGKPYEPP